MADPNTTGDVQYDDDGKPITPAGGSSEGGEGGAAAATTPEGGDTPPEGEDTDDVTPPTRKSVAQHIITRQKDTIEKLREGQGGEGDAPLAPIAGEEDLSPEAQTAVDKAVQKQLNPVLDSVAKQSDEGELQHLFTNDPESKKYEKRIRAYMNNPAYSSVPPVVIYQSLAFAQAQIIGAQRKGAADLDAGQGRSGGAQHRPTEEGGSAGAPTTQEVSEMSTKDLEKLETDALRGKFVNK